MRRWSPSRAIWFHPSQTVARVAHENPEYRLLALPFLAGFAIWPTIALFDTENETIGGFFLSTVLSFGPFGEIAQLFIGAYLIRVTGKWLGGRAGLASIGTVIAWGNLPIVWLAVLSLALSIASNLFHEHTGESITWNQSQSMSVFAWTLFSVQLLAVAWSFVIFLRGLARVQGYSMARSAANAVLAWLIAAGLVAIAAILLGQVQSLGWLFLSGLDEWGFENGS